MAIFLTSDLHFGHDKEFVYKDRGFNSMEEHDAAIIERWNSVVTDEDEVYVLGDLMLGDNEAGMDKLLQLNGHIYIIAGNHDTERRIDMYTAFGDNKLEFLGFARRLKKGKWSFMLSHYPMITANPGEEYQKVWSIHGHTHSKWKYSGGRCYNVNMDAHDCYPVNLENIITDLKEIKINETH